MKLIIDVPDNVYAKVMEYYEHNEIVEAVYSYIYCGIPLEQIRAEIESNMESIIGKYDSSIPKSNMPSYKIERNKVRKECISIIDKYR